MEEIKPSVKVLYTAQIHSTGVCEHGVSRSSDGRLNSKQSAPGTNGVGTSPNNSLLQGGLPVLKEQWVSLHSKCTSSFQRRPLLSGGRLVFNHQTCPSSKAITGMFQLNTTSGSVIVKYVFISE